MKNIAIICEYNPMHYGHIYQIKKIKNKYPNSNIIVLMSTSFVQRGEPSILNKFDKAYISIKNEVDLVLEMPTIITLQSADYFSKYCIKILNDLKILDYISFGIEEDETLFFKNINKILENENTILKLQKKFIEKGYSYKSSYIEALNTLKLNSSILSKPNNILAFQYIKALKNLNSTISPLPIKREDGGYHSKKLDSFNFQSASTIRKLFLDKKEIKKYVPNETSEKMNTSKNYNIDQYSDIFYFLVKIENRKPDNIAGYENGMLNLLINNFKTSISQSISDSHNKRYSISRLKRFVINYLLNITSEDIKKLDTIAYIRPIGFNEKGSTILKQIKKNENIEIINDIVKYTKNPNNQRFLDIDKLAYKLQNIMSKDLIKLDYNHIPFIK